MVGYSIIARERWGSTGQNLVVPFLLLVVRESSKLKSKQRKKMISVFIACPENQKDFFRPFTRDESEMNRRFSHFPSIQSSMMRIILATVS